jgi:hypothetical protein
VAAYMRLKAGYKKHSQLAVVNEKCVVCHVPHSPFVSWLSGLPLPLAQAAVRYLGLKPLGTASEKLSSWMRAR